MRRLGRSDQRKRYKFLHYGKQRRHASFSYRLMEVKGCFHGDSCSITLVVALMDGLRHVPCFSVLAELIHGM